MTMKFRKSRLEDRGKIRALLMETKLPTESIDKEVTTLYIAEDDGRLVGIAGFEFYGDDALLRSVSILPGLQRQGLGSEIVNHMLDEARKKRVRRVILLTETAKDFFFRKGFNVVDRTTIDNEELKKSSEFAYSCPTSAVCMLMELKQKRS